MTDAQNLPLSGTKVVEFTHMVMGPTAGLILGDLGADVIKVEPLNGDNTRRLQGSGAGYFPLPAVFGKFDVTHSHFITYKIEKK